MKYVEDMDPEAGDRVELSWPPWEHDSERKRVQGEVRIHNNGTKPKFIVIGGDFFDSEGLRARKGKAKKKREPLWSDGLRVHYNDDEQWKLFSKLSPEFLPYKNDVASKDERKREPRGSGLAGARRSVDDATGERGVTMLDGKRKKRDDGDLGRQAVQTWSD